MKFWYLDTTTYKPVEVDAIEGNYGLWLIRYPELDSEMVVSRNLLFDDPVSCAKAGIEKLKKDLIENERKTAALLGQNGPNLHSNFKKTKVPYLWIVK